jgi:ABC-type uncharacterized transport system involved in gliding motility auxiliary subunit
MAREWMKSRTTKYAAYAGAYVIVILAVLVAVNFLANRYDKSYDATSNKQFSLSDQTIKQVKNLPRDVTITYFGAQTEFASARDLLGRYSSLSPKLHVNYVDPERKPTVAKAAGFRSDSPVIIDSGVRKEAAKSLTEEEITGALIRSLKSGERNVCVLQAAGEASIDDTQAHGFSFMKQLLERDNYKVRTVDLKPKTEAPKQVAIGQAPAPVSVEVPKDCTVLVVGGAQQDYPAPYVDAIRKYIQGGGRAIIMLDNTLPIGRDQAAPEQPELTKMLADWGVTVNKDLVLDLSGIGQIFGLGPEVPVVLSYESHPITQPLTRVPTAYRMARSLDIKSSDKATATKLVATTEDSVAVEKIGPGGSVDPRQGRKGPLTLAAAITLNGTPQGRVVVVGTSAWAQNMYLGSRQLGNRDLLANSVNWLSSDEDLISIRPKQPEDRPVNMTTQRLMLVFWLSVVIFPLGVVAFGMATWWKRR